MESPSSSYIIVISVILIINPIKRICLSVCLIYVMSYLAPYLPKTHLILKIIGFFIS